MGFLDTVISLVLFGCYFVYVVMGISLTAMGAYYLMEPTEVMGDAGLILLVVGVGMLAIGGLATFANWKKIWLLLVLVELFNISLFLVLYILMVCALIMATGTEDPVRRATQKGWSEALPFLTSAGSAGGDYPDGIYCELYGGARCGAWYQAAVSATDDCTIGEAGSLSVKMALDNCTQLAPGEPYDSCTDLYSQCQSCETACMDAAIQDVKEAIVPVSMSVFALCGYLAIAVLWNNLLLASDELAGFKRLMGLGINGGLVLVSLAMTVMAGLAIATAQEDCQSMEGGCVPDTLYALVGITVGLMIVAAMCIGGLQINNSMLLRIGTMVMVVLSLLCLLTGLVLGISSGIVMDDMEYYYDINYPRLRSALEEADTNYCKLRKDDCTLLAGNAGAVPPKICNEDYSECNPVEGAQDMTPASVWPNMWAVAAAEASIPANLAANPWLEPCETSGVCIFCNDFYASVQLDPAEQVVDGVTQLCEGAGTEDTSDDVACLAAPNLNWKDAVTPPASDSIDNRWTGATRLLPTGADEVLKCAQSAEKCDVADSTFPYTAEACAATDSEDACDDVDGCIFDAAEGNCVLQDGIRVASNADKTGWADIIGNYSSYQSRSWRSNQLKCELALMRHTKVEEDGSSVCKGAGSSVPDGDAGFYMADCDSCNPGDSGRDFIFDSSQSSSYCLSFFVGHMEHVCKVHDGAATCQDEFWVSTDKNSHIEYFVDSAYTTDGALDRGSAAPGEATDFCDYSDDGCKAKIKDSIESAMSTVGIVVGSFVGFFIIIIYCTLQGIKMYRRSGSDEDVVTEVEIMSDE